MKLPANEPACIFGNLFSFPVVGRDGKKVPKLFHTLGLRVGGGADGCQGVCNEGSRKILARMFPVAHYKNDPGGQKRGA